MSCEAVSRAPRSRFACARARKRFEMDELFNGTVAPATERAGAPRSPGAGHDLSAQVEQAVAREPMDRVRCVRVFGNCYRCNWWAPTTDPLVPMAEWARLAAHRVRKSRF